MNSYLDKVDEAVRISVQSLRDIEIDAYNNDGCNGYVFFGNHKIFGRRVAVKYYDYGENAHQEVSLIKGISNEHILKVWDAHTIENRWAYFITDEQTNGSLEILIENSNIDTDTAINIIRGVLKGVGSLHEYPNNLLHRDLKPANILISDNMSPIIADFGSIKRIPLGSNYVNASKHSALYRPPEAYERGEYTYSSDIYQIGILLYQVMGGKLSYKATDYMTRQELREYNNINDVCDQSLFADNCIFDKSKRGKLLDYNSLPAYVDRRIVQIIKQATKYDCSGRYTNVSEFQLALYNLGRIPNWKRKEEALYCVNNSIMYRILHNSKNKYLVEKSSKGKWFKMRGSKCFDNEKMAINWLSKTF